jgi:hydroxymethylglutaryl-CoA lyase
MFKNIGNKIEIVEVGPRDGLQNESKILDLNVKLEYIRKLIAAGIQTIEMTSFVSPKKIPQMSDSELLLKKIKEEKLDKQAKLIGLVPNSKGLENALKAGIENIAVFTATSESFNKKNINVSIEESLKKIEVVCKDSKKHGLNIRGYISTAFGCPYEGETSIDLLLKLVKKFKDFGCYQISIGDTIGVATPSQVNQMIDALRSEFDLKLFSMHFHDTRSMALANILVSLEKGIKSFDSSSGGLGGCPYAKGSTGNVATEELVYLFESLGMKTGVDQKKLVEASTYILGQVGKETTSKLLKTYQANGI